MRQHSSRASSFDSEKGSLARNLDTSARAPGTRTQSGIRVWSHVRDHHGRVRSSVFSTWSYETEQPPALEALRESTRKLPGNIYRAKGVVCAGDVPRRRAVLEEVGRRVDISFQEEWGERAPRMQIVAIGAAGAIDASLLGKHRR